MIKNIICKAAFKVYFFFRVFERFSSRNIATNYEAVENHDFAYPESI